MHVATNRCNFPHAYETRWDSDFIMTIMRIMLMREPNLIAGGMKQAFPTNSGLSIPLLSDFLLALQTVQVPPMNSDPHHYDKLSVTRPLLLYLGIASITQGNSSNW